MDPINPSDPRLPKIPDPRPDFPLDPPAPETPIVELAPWWLSATCGCGRHSYHPLRRLAALRGWQTPLSAILARLKCERCGAAPHSVELVADPASRKGEATDHRVRIG